MCTYPVSCITLDIRVACSNVYISHHMYTLTIQYGEYRVLYFYPTIYIVLDM